MQENSGRKPLSQVLFSFKGRIGRGTLWGVWLSITVVGFVIEFLFGGSFGSGYEGFGVSISIYFLYLILSVWISFAIQVKRWHDRNKSGWMLLINFIPIIGWLWAFVELGFLKGTTGPNQYGEDPLQSIEKKSETVVP